MRTDVQSRKAAAKQPRLPASDTSFAPKTWLEGGMALLDEQGRLIEINDRLIQWLNNPETTLIGKSFWDALEKLSPAWREPLARLRGDKAAFSQANLQLSPAPPRPAQWISFEVARNKSGWFVRMSSTLPPLSPIDEAAIDGQLRNDSARREMFTRLLRAESQLDRLQRRSPCVLFSQRPDFGFQSASPNILELTGIAAEAWAAQRGKFWELVHEADAEELRRQFARAAQTGAVISNSFRIRHALTGRVAYVLEHRQPVLSPDGLLVSYEAMWIDITRQTVAERRLTMAAWKETLAVLTLGMTHDFRNMMAGIHSLSETFLAQVEGNHPFKEGLSLIQRNSLQASQLVQRIINLHLGQTGERSYHDLNEIARDLADLLSKILPRRVRIETELAPKSLPIYADLVELRQVIINLMLNAADAMPKSGVLQLRTARHENLPKLKHVKGALPRLPAVSITIADTGTGIKARHLDSIFDPFFTTKAKGSGLGLYNARIAIERHQGAISVESEEGKGTRFHLWLPQSDLSESTAEQERRATRRSLVLMGAAGELLDKTAELLRSHNYYVVIATAPESLPELLQSSDYQFDGAMLLAGPNDPATAAFLTDTTLQRKDLKIALKFAGCSPDDLDSHVLREASLLLPQDLPESAMLAKLEAFLD